MISRKNLQHQTNAVTGEKFQELPKLELEELENLSAGLKRQNKCDMVQPSHRYGDIIVDGAALDMD